jgi:hypothetical protein
MFSTKRACFSLSCVLTALASGGCLFLVAGLTSLKASASPLITRSEAALPAPEMVTGNTRAITRGPRVEMVAPGDAAPSPLRLQLAFRTFGGAQIDLDSVRVTYLRSPTVDLTPRVKPFLQPTGIDMPDAEAPPGEYALRIDVKDTEGRATSATFTLKVAP